MCMYDVRAKCTLHVLDTQSRRGGGRRGGGRGRGGGIAAAYRRATDYMYVCSRKIFFFLQGLSCGIQALFSIPTRHGVLRTRQLCTLRALSSETNLATYSTRTNYDYSCCCLAYARGGVEYNAVRIHDGMS